MDLDITEADRVFILDNSKSIILHTLPTEAHSFIAEGILDHTKLNLPLMFAAVRETL